jgi:hypothetical protein
VKPNSDSPRNRGPSPSTSGMRKGAPPKPGLRRWTLSLTISAVMIVAVVTAFATVSVAQATPFSFSVTNPGGSMTPYNHTTSFAHAGTIVFTWSKSGANGVTFSVRVASSGALLYSMSATSANVTLNVHANTPYKFGVQTEYATTVSVSGNLDFKAPVLVL